MFRFANMLILKVTKDCNFRCEYCYVKHKDDYKNQIIEFSTYKKVIDRICRDRANSTRFSPNEKFSLVFHGGEPLLIGKDYLVAMIEYALYKFKEYNINFTLGMQTNLSLLDEEYAQILEKYGISLGVSFDGIKSGNRGRSSLKQNTFEQKFDLITKYNISYGVLMVVNKYNYKHVLDTINYLEKKYNINGIKANYAEDVYSTTEESDFEISGEDYFHYVVRPIIDEFIKTGKLNEGNTNHLILKFIVDILTFHSNRVRYNCGGKICGAGINIVELDPDGEMYFCGRYSEPFEEVKMMHIDDPDFLALQQINKYITFSGYKHKALLDTHCDTCPADYVCEHGCMAFHYSKYGTWGTREKVVCNFWKLVYNYLSRHAVDIIKAYHKVYKINGETKFNAKEKIYGLKNNKIKEKLDFGITYEDKYIIFKDRSK